MTDALWTDETAVAATGGEATAAFSATGVSIDTRSLKPGDLFVALNDQRDGHDFLAAAFAAGAAAAMVSHIPEGAPEAGPYLIVEDPLAGLRGLATAARARTGAKVIAVTGSVGKTGTKEMLRAALEASGKTHAAEKSFNNHWGAPLTLARMPADTDFAVIELGMNHPGRLRRFPNWRGRILPSLPRWRLCISKASRASMPLPMPRQRFSPAWPRNPLPS